jgi:hypothetical protein
VFAKRIFRSPAAPFLSRIPVPPPLSSKPQGIISFADPHHLTPIESYRSKNIEGRGHSRQSNPQIRSLDPGCICGTCQNSRQLSPFCSCTYKMPLVQPFSFDNDPFSWGVWGVLHLFDVRTPKPLDVSTCFRVIPFPFTFLRTLLHSCKAQPFSFQAFPHSLPKTTRGGGTPLGLRQSPAYPNALGSTSHDSQACPDPVGVTASAPSAVLSFGRNLKLITYD